MRSSHHIAFLSRGYKRRTKGFVLATSKSTPRDIGDEAYQIYHKFGGDVSVAVCEDRVHGIRELLSIDPDINMVVLDDAFQHRYVKPDVAVVVTEYNRPVFEDKLLPYGRLRERARYQPCRYRGGQQMSRPVETCRIQYFQQEHQSVPVSESVLLPLCLHAAATGVSRRRGPHPLP